MIVLETQRSARYWHRHSDDDRLELQVMRRWRSPGVSAAADRRSDLVVYRRGYTGNRGLRQGHADRVSSGYDRAAAKGTCKNCPAFRERNRSALRLLRVEGKGKERRMLTANEYRAEAKACRELADRAAEIYVKAALIELARDYDRAARQAERREHHLRVFGASENTRAVA